MLNRLLVVLVFSALLVFYYLIMRDSDNSMQSVANIQSSRLGPSVHPDTAITDSASSSIAFRPIVNRGESDRIPQENKVVGAEKTTNALDSSIALKKSEEFSRYSQSLVEKGISLQKDIFEQFQKEPVDSEWAPFYEEKIRHFFIGTKSLNDYEPDSILCKTTKCQIQLYVANDQELADAAQRFTNAFLSDGDFVQHSDVVAVPDFSKKTVLLYIGRDKDTTAYQ